MSKELTPFQALEYLVNIALLNGEDGIIGDYYNVIVKALEEHELMKIVTKDMFLTRSKYIDTYMLCLKIDDNSWKVIRLITKEECDLLKGVLSWHNS